MGQLTVGGQAVFVDDADLALVSGWRWHIHVSGTNRYARGRRPGQGSTGGHYMHRLLMGASPGQEIDHVNGDGLDNRRANLRFCTRSENNANRYAVQSRTSTHKGVHFEARTRCWRAEVTKNGTRYRMGRFSTEAEAAAAYDQKARELFPAFGHGASSSK